MNWDPVINLLILGFFFIPSNVVAAIYRIRRRTKTFQSKMTFMVALQRDKRIWSWLIIKVLVLKNLNLRKAQYILIMHFWSKTVKLERTYSAWKNWLDMMTQCFELFLNAGVLGSSSLSSRDWRYSRNPRLMIKIQIR